jgi:predicted PurR-regulated permease PerM
MESLRSKLEQHLGWIALVLVLAGCLIVLFPFVSAILWAIILCSSSWPLYERLLRGLRGRRTLAAAVMTGLLVVVMLLPFVIVGVTLADNVEAVSAAVRKWFAVGPPRAPDWVEKLPVVGREVAAAWQLLATDGRKFLADAQRFLEPVSLWLLKAGLGLGRGLLDLALSILVAFFLFRDGPTAAEWLTTSVKRIGGEEGQRLLEVASKTMRGVVYGILGTALVQAVLAGIGFWIAGVPGAGLLALLTFFLSVVPVGPPLIWIPAALWLFAQGATGWGVFMLIWGTGVSSVDNVVKPWLISQGNEMPFILIFFGVLGGVMAFGLIGVFLGTTLLAVGYRLVKEWASTNVATVPLATKDHEETVTP